MGGGTPHGPCARRVVRRGPGNGRDRLLDTAAAHHRLAGSEFALEEGGGRGLERESLAGPVYGGNCIGALVAPPCTGGLSAGRAAMVHFPSANRKHLDPPREGIPARIQSSPGGGKRCHPPGARRFSPGPSP